MTPPDHQQPLRCQQPPNHQQALGRHERGQATIALVAVILLVILGGLALSVLADAMVHRARARTAADAVALAVAADPDAAAGLIARYRQAGISIEHDGTTARARSGPSQAMAWAENSAGGNQPAPALVAIIARAEQLTGGSFAQVQWDRLAVVLPADQAPQLRLVAAELGLCELADSVARPGWNVFALC